MNDICILIVAMLSALTVRYTDPVLGSTVTTD